MTDRLTSVTVRGFRAVADEFAIDFPSGQSAAILGPNGTGKSTLTDAIEWYFKGEIRPLSREGREGAIRHLGATRETEVVITTTGSLGGSVTYPGSAPTKVTQIGRSEVFVLRGSTLADFMERTKGEKWRALAEILGLDELDLLRRDLQTAANELRNRDDQAILAFRSAAGPFREKGVEPTEANIVELLAVACRHAGVKEPTSIADVSMPDWAAVFGAGSTGTRRAISLATLRTELAAIDGLADLQKSAQDWNAIIASGRTKDQRRLTFMRLAQTYVESRPTPGRCPLCGQDVDDAQLARDIVLSLRDLKGAADEADRADAFHAKVERGIDAALRTRTGIANRAKTLGVDTPELPTAPAALLSRAKTAREQITEETIREFAREIAGWDGEVLKGLEAAESQTASTRNKELAEAGMLRELAIRWKTAADEFGKTHAAREFADAVFEEYQAAFGEYFGRVLDDISGRAAVLYERLHPNEGIDNVRIEVAGEKGVELSARFHGQVQKPPHGVLSESHLNSLGVALFLAMAEVLNKDLGFIVLDDVVNSFDVEHRGRLAEVLADEFDERQLLVLTHDPQFFGHLVRRAPDWLRVEYTSWGYQAGPRVSGYTPRNLVERAGLEMADGNLDGSARTARRAVEEVLQEICEGLQAPLPFRRGTRNDQREIGEVLPGVRRILKELAPKRYAALREVLDGIEADVATVLNVESHASTGWSSAGEIGDAIGRIEKLSAEFSCSKCSTRVWRVGTPAASRCRCGTATFP